MTYDRIKVATEIAELINKLGPDSIQERAKLILEASRQAMVFHSDLQKAIDWWNDDEYSKRNVL